MAPVIIVVESNQDNARKIRRALQDAGRRVLLCHSAREALSLLPEVRPGLIVASMDLNDLPGADAIRLFQERAMGVPILGVTRHNNVPRAVAAVRAGAVDLHVYPVSPAMLREAADRAMSESDSRRALQHARQAAADRDGFSDMLTRSPRMLQVFDQIRSVAPTDATVLIRGETGTGKELVARAIHERSPRAQRPQISVNCGAFTETLLESELFGHEKGSFTSASGRRRGVFEMANGGTLFLDELGETSLSVQVNLLRVLETFRFHRVGGQEEIDVDVRIIAATHVDLERAVQARRFRQDLFYRLNVFPITLPTLRERREDIPLLLQYFFEQATKAYGFSDPPSVTGEAMEIIQGYHWPGNVRQLRSMCERWTILANAQSLTPEMLPVELTGATPLTGHSTLHIEEGVPMKTAVDHMVAEVERAYLHRLLQRHAGHLTLTATEAGITRRTLYNKMKSYQLDATDYR